MEINNKTFLVTGAASGLGLATAEMIVQNGGNAVLCDINTERGEATQNKLGTHTVFIRTDVTNEVSVQNAIEIAVEKFGALHGAINCAGVAPGERILGKSGVHTLSNFKKVIDINLIGTFNVLRFVAEVIQKNNPEETASNERGIIINTASVAAFDGQIGQAAYAASKGAVVSMTLPIARELARFGIRIMAIAPGIFETPMLMGMTEEVRQSLGSQVPFPSRLGQPKEYAFLVKHIIENVMLNGEVIRLDGAIRMTSK